jgi:acyl-CoA thioesterase FadM
VATRISHIGNKSIKFEFQLLDKLSGEILSTAETINVAYDYATEQTRLVPNEWREAINLFEKKTF